MSTETISLSEADMIEAIRLLLNQRGQRMPSPPAVTWRISPATAFEGATVLVERRPSTKEAIGSEPGIVDPIDDDDDSQILSAP